MASENKTKENNDKRDILTTALLEASQNLLNKIEKNIEQIHALKIQSQLGELNAEKRERI